MKAAYCTDMAAEWFGKTRFRRCLALCAWVSGVASATVLGQVPQVPLGALLEEAEQILVAGEGGAAAGLLDEVISRVDSGEVLPGGLGLNRLVLAAASLHFQAGGYARSAELARRLEATEGLPGAALGEARMILGLALALQESYREAVPVFARAESDPAQRDKARLYGAMSAAQAGEKAVAIEVYSRLLAESPRDRDWADSALALVDLYLQEGRLADARRGLALLRGRQEMVDNLAGLNLLSVRLGDALAGAGDHAGALAAYRAATTRTALIAGQRARLAALERAVGHYRSQARPTPTEADAARRLGNRLEQARTALAELEKLPAYDAALRQRLALAFQSLDRPWEAALLFEHILAEHSEHTEREACWFGLVRAYAEAGRFEQVRDAVGRFAAEFPGSGHAPQALYLAAVAAGEKGEFGEQLDFLGVALEKHAPEPALVETMLLLRANALFTLLRFAEARAAAAEALEKYPTGRYREEAGYLVAMAELAEGRASEAEKLIKAHLREHPDGKFAADARYRLAAIAYAREDHAGSARLCEKWLREHDTDHPQRGEVYSLHGDALAAGGDLPAAIAAYRAALERPLPDELLGYVMDELTRHYQTQRDTEAAVALWDGFASARPDHPFVINAAYWVSRLRAREGRGEEALEFMARVARRHLDDPERADVERLLVELAANLARPRRAAPGEPKPEPASEAELAARVEELLQPGEAVERPTAGARAMFVAAEMAGRRGDAARRVELLEGIARRFAPDQLPPGILGQVGDVLLAAGHAELARSCYERILAAHGRTHFADYGHVGLGEIALREGKAAEAESRFEAAIDQAGARFKLKEAMLGRARARFALGRLHGARELYEQIAANRAWRGEATAEALFHLGEIERESGGPDALAKAQAHYQRVYLSYKKHGAWVARAYLRSAETFELLGQRAEALDTVNRFFTEERLRVYEAEWRRAQALHARLNTNSSATGAPGDA